VDARALVAQVTAARGASPPTDFARPFKQPQARAGGPIAGKALSDLVRAALDG
jgi:hypothetical protein